MFCQKEFKVALLTKDPCEETSLNHIFAKRLKNTFFERTRILQMQALLTCISETSETTFFDRKNERNAFKNVNFKSHLEKKNFL